jgi:hypothetical protein
VHVFGCSNAAAQEGFLMSVYTGDSAIYAIESDGRLKWYKHNGASRGEGVETPGAWEGPRVVGTGWQNFQKVFSAGPRIYAIGKDGRLWWYHHWHSENGDGVETPGAWEGPRNVGSGWENFLNVAGYALVTNAILYAIGGDGTLWWYSHQGYEGGEGVETPGAWEGPRAVGTGWQNFKNVFAGVDLFSGRAILYAIRSDGTLLWYRHNGSVDGEGVETPGAWVGPRAVGTGWQNFKSVFTPGQGIIYAIGKDGTLWWYKHNGAAEGEGVETAGAWDGPRAIGTGWQNFLSVFVAGWID